MAIFDPVVDPSAHLAAIEIAEITHRCRVKAQAAGDDGVGFAVAI